MSALWRCWTSLPCYLLMNSGELEKTRRKGGWGASDTVRASEWPTSSYFWALVIKGWAVPGLCPLIRGSAGWCFEEDPHPRSHPSILVLIIFSVPKKMAAVYNYKGYVNIRDSQGWMVLFYPTLWLDLPFSTHCSFSFYNLSNSSHITYFQLQK